MQALDHRTGYRIRSDDLTSCVCIGFAPKTAIRFSVRCLSHSATNRGAGITWDEVVIADYIKDWH
ncbi:hypothetical protein FG93_03150 [Bosea sp. LC85]|nr:hypothetical protein FG93_03150 [Bosea sp. LC85]